MTEQLTEPLDTAENERSERIFRMREKDFWDWLREGRYLALALSVAASVADQKP